LYLSAQTNRLIEGKAGPTFSEEGVHEVLGKVLGKHKEFRYVQLRVAWPPEVVFHQALEIIFVDGLFR
jgi:hypothetical protein